MKINLEEKSEIHCMVSKNPKIYKAIMIASQDILLI